MTTSWHEARDARAERGAKAFAEFVKTVADLRHPKDGCPWDLEQDHVSLRRYMLEEAYEAAEAMLQPPYGPDLLDELGDVLLQVVLNAQLASDGGYGEIADIVEAINAKMRRRHPHVFAPTEAVLSPDDVTERWAQIKAEERKASAKAKERVFAKAQKVHPALTQSFQIGKVAKSIQFDWGSTDDVMKQFESELDELKVEMKSGKKELIAKELSDCFFSLAQLSRHLGFEPEEIAQRGNIKFLKRFEKLEDLAESEGLDVRSAGTEKLEELWQRAKRKEN